MNIDNKYSVNSGHVLIVNVKLLDEVNTDEYVEFNEESKFVHKNIFNKFNKKDVMSNKIKLESD